MTGEERKKKISDIKKGTPIATGTILKYQGTTQKFDVYRIPLECLVYNVENGRISSLVKSYTKEHSQLDPSNDNDAKKIEEFLFSSSEERNKKTKDDLIANGQIEPGIITADGVIVDGNRRASLLRAIYLSHPDQNVRDKCAYFNTRILPEDADPKEILRLETTYQMAADSKVDYNPIEKYLHAKDMKEHGFSTQQIMEDMGFKSQSEVNNALEIMGLIDEYLENFGYDGIYTRMPKGFEDDLLKLNQTIKQIEKGGNKCGWSPQDRIEEVITDLKAISFDYIRLDEKGDFDFRAIAYTASGNILQHQDTWDKFVEKYNDAQEDIKEEESVDDVLSKAKSDKDSKHLLDNRDTKWRNNVRESLMDAFKECNDIVESKKEVNKPAVLINKAKNSIEAIDKISLFNAPNKDTLIKTLQEIAASISDLTAKTFID